MRLDDEMNVYGGCIALARGKNDYLAATPCECDPDVRQLWQNWVDQILRTGADGIDLRISAHGSLTDEPFNYGMNDWRIWRIVIGSGIRFVRASPTSVD